MQRNKKETIQFKKTITAGQTLSGATALIANIRAHGTIERIMGKFNAGQQNQLQIRPYLFRTGERIEELVTYPSGQSRYLSGDNDSFDIGVDFDVYPDDQIRLDVTNASSYDYTCEISFEVDYVGGTRRVI